MSILEILFETALENIDQKKALDEALLEVEDLLKNLAASQPTSIGIETAFGENYSREKFASLVEQWKNSDFQGLPIISVRSAFELEGALGAYVAENNTIYLSHEYVAANAANSDALAAVVLEEIGHAIDAQINTSDAPGDEGAIFSNIVRGIPLDAATLQALKAEDDRATLTLDGQTVLVERAEPTFNIDELLAGLESSLDNIQDKVNALLEGAGLPNTQGILGSGLPFLGNEFTEKAKAGAQFIKELYERVKLQLFDISEGTKEADRSKVHDALFEAFKDIIKDANGNKEIDKEDIKVNITPEGVLTVDLDLGGKKSLTGVTLPNNLGLPQLGLEFQDSQIGVDLDFTFDLSFDYNPNAVDKFLFNLNADPKDAEITLDIKPILPAASATFGFLKVDVKDNVNQESKGTLLNFSLDLSDGNDNKLKAGENLIYTPQGSAEIDLNLLSSLGSSAVLPKIGADFNLKWDFIGGDQESDKPTVSFNNVQLYLGSFLSDFVKPIVNPIQTITQPIQKATSFLMEPIGLLQDLNLGGENHNLLGLAKEFNPDSSGFDIAKVEKTIEIIQLIDRLAAIANSVDSSAEDIGINFGSFTLGSIDLTNGSSLSTAKIAVAGQDMDNKAKEKFARELAEQEQQNAENAKKYQAQKEFFAEFGDTSSDGSYFSFPILNNPTSAIGLLLGQNVDLFKLNLPEFYFTTGEIKAKYPLPPLPIIQLSLSGEIEAGLKLGFGYDSSGIQQWAAGGYNSNNIAQIFDGFYIDDHRVNGKDLPELKIVGTIKAGVGIGGVVAEAEVNGGIQAIVNIDLEDGGEAGQNLGSSDGKIRPSEFLPVLLSEPGCLFEIGGQIDALLGYYVRVGYPPFGKEWEGELARTTLANFGISTCPEKQPILANEGSDKFVGGILDLNIGLRADKRMLFNTVDESERFSLKGLERTSIDPIKETIAVNAFGYTQQYIGVNKIVANAGDLDDVIDVENIAVQIEFSGGSGDDTLSGGEGNDILNGDSGDDSLSGRGGDDTLLGGDGNDIVKGGEGNDVIFGGNDNDRLLGEGSNDTIDGGAGNDFINGGSGNDKLYGDSSDSQAGKDAIFGGDGRDELYGLAGNDSLSGGEGEDRLYGGIDDDDLLGDGGNDFLMGEAGNDRISGGEGNDTVSYENSTGGVIANIDEEQSYASAGEGIDLEPVFNINAAEAYDGFGTKDSFKFMFQRTVYNESTDQILTTTYPVSGGLENIIGSSFNDILIGNSQDNLLQSAAGNDFLIGNAGNDTIDGGADIDTVSYRRDLGSVNVNLAANRATDGWGGIDAIYNVENVVGSAFTDAIIGDAKANSITAGNGDDYVAGGEGNDLLYGDAGNDELAGGTGQDSLYGGEGNDTLNGNAGDDFISGDAGDDFLMGEAGDDFIDGGTEVDTVSYENSASGVVVNIDEAQNYQNPGGSLHATIVSSSPIPTDPEPNFTIDAGTAKDGFGTTDTLRNLENIIGSEFNDVLIGNSLDNRIEGKAGDDLFVGNAGNDYFDGGDDIDTVSYRRDPNQAKVKVSLELNQATDGFGNSDRLYNVENVIGSFFNDEIIGDAKANIIHAGEGSDLVRGRDGNDILFGQKGQDSLFGENGDDFLVGGEDADLLDGGAGNDTASYFTSSAGVTVSLTTGQGLLGDAQGDRLTNIENLEGSEFDDLLIGNAGKNIVSGLGGNDLIYGEAGDDWLDGGAGSDRAYGGDGNDLIYGQSGNDFIYGEAGNDSLYGGDDNDQLYGQSGTDFLEGGSGDDWLDGGDSNDLLKGGDGDDQLYGQSGEDTLNGEAGNDFLDGGLGNDLLNGGNGNDVLYGQIGDDILNGEAGDDFLDGGLWNDLLNGGDGNDVLYGQNGRDLLNGGNGNDRLFGGEDTDTLNGNAGDDYLDGGTGKDFLYGNDGNDFLYGNDGNDFLAGNAGDDSLDGGLGDDELQGNDGNDRLYGNLGNDRLDGGLGNDFLYGGLGDDILYGTAGDNLLDGGKGKDVLYGGSDRDLFVLAAGAGSDTIFNFVDGVDSLGLVGLTFNDLSITQGSGSSAGNTFVALASSKELLATLTNVQANTLTFADFTTV